MERLLVEGTASFCNLPWIWRPSANESLKEICWIFRAKRFVIEKKFAAKVIFAKKIFLIVGCQRSGSTLLESVFNAHPEVHVVGEEQGEAYRYFREPAKLDGLPKESICLRIPAATHLIKHAIEKLPGARVLFTLRDPRDVVVSMRKLEVQTQADGPSGKWLVLFGHNEIRRCIASLAERERLEEKLRSLYEQTNDLNDPRFGAFCWMVKNRFIPLYERSILPTKVVRYEMLIANPEPYLRQICQFLSLEWNDHLLEHEKYSSGQWGGTNKGEAIHQRSFHAYKKNLSIEERRALYSVIRPEMEAMGYLELFD
jgi:protein-tyrosine sulfotransferase